MKVKKNSKTIKYWGIYFRSFEKKRPWKRDWIRSSTARRF